MVYKFRFAQFLTVLALSSSIGLAEILSICDRTVEVRTAILEDIEIQRLTKGSSERPRCSSVDSEELAKIEILLLTNTLLRPIAQNDFSGLTNVSYLDLGNNSLTNLNTDILLQLPSLKNIYVAKNDIAVDSNFTSYTNEAEIDVNFGDEKVKTGETVFSPTEHAAQKLKNSVKAYFKLPLDVNVGNISTRKEEAQVVRQLYEVGKAYRSSAFDFFTVNIDFGMNDEAGVKSNGFEGKLVITIPEGGEIIKSDLIESALASGFDRKAMLRWYRGTQVTTALIRESIDRDLEKLATIEQNLKVNIILLSDMLAAAHERSQEGSERLFYTASELNLARYVQFQVMLGLHRAMNTIVRWQAAEKDQRFPFHADASYILHWGGIIYKTYSNWFLSEVAGNRAVLNIFKRSWWHRNLIGKILDEEAHEGEIIVDGHRSAYIPAGSIQAMMKYRINRKMKKWLKSLDRPYLHDERTQNTLKIAQSHPFSGARAWKELWDGRIKNTANWPIYHAVVGIAGWLGDTRVHKYEPSITVDQLHEMEKTLKAGDILLERQDHFLSNAFLPGFWPHAILYLGPIEEWSSLRLPDGSKLSEDPWIRKNIFPKYQGHHNNHQLAVIEAVSEGVIFSSLDHSSRKDYIAVLRPTFPESEREGKIAQAIRQALKFHGRPYDFDFNYATDDKIVCTELIYRAYDPQINFGVQKNAPIKPVPRVPGIISTMGRNTMPANEIARYVIYMADHPKADPQINYSGQTLEVISLYMKEKDEKPALVFHGQEALMELRRSVDL